MISATQEATKSLHKAMSREIPFLTVNAKNKVYGYSRCIPADVRYIFANKSERKDRYCGVPLWSRIKAI
jgi:hypothetical protein